MHADPDLTRVHDRSLLLRGIPGFTNVSEEGLFAITERATTQRFKAGEKMVTAGELPDRMYFVLDGNVRIERGGKLDTQIERIGEVGLYETLAGVETSTLEATVTGPTLALEVPAEVLRSAIGRDATLGRAVMRFLARRLLIKRNNLPPGGPIGSVESPGAFPARRFTPIERLLQLMDTPLGRAANTDMLADIARSAKEVRYEPGDLLWKIGEPATHWIRVDFGIAHCTSHDGTVVEFGNQGVLGILDTMAEMPRVYGVQAKTTIIGLESYWSDFVSTVDVYPPMAQRMSVFWAELLLR